MDNNYFNYDTKNLSNTYSLIDLEISNDIYSIEHTSETESNTIINNKKLFLKPIINDINLQDNIIEHINNNILYWEEKFNKYCELEELCNTNINNIIDIKNNLKNLVGQRERRINGQHNNCKNYQQEKDDMIFYQSIIDNSVFYLLNSLKIRRIKFLKDLNIVWEKLNDNNNKNKELNKIFFQSLLKDYKKLADDINISKKNNITLNWIKDEKIENLQEFEIFLTEIIKYHLKLIESLYILINHEKKFYCDK